MGCCGSQYRKTADAVSEGVDLGSQTILITGPTSGIGEETACTLAKRKAARLILAARDEKKNAALCERLKKETGNQNIVPMALDLASFKSIRAFAAKYKEAGYPLHILICNAGVSMIPYRKTEEGLEFITGTNHFGHFLLTTLLLDVLEKSAPSRIVVVSSSLHAGTPIKFDDIPTPKQSAYGAMSQYQQSKLMNLLMVKELHRRYADKKISSFALHPGVIQTNILREAACMACFMCVCASCCTKSPAQGAATTVYCATAKGLESKSGQYFADSQECPCDKVGNDAEAAKKLWEVSEKICGQQAADGEKKQ